MGSGKSLALCQEAIKLSYQNPGRLGLIGAPTYPMLRDATQRQFLEICEKAALPYSFHRTENRVTLDDTGSEILFRSLDRFERLRGPNLAWFGADELTYTDPEAWERLEARLRDPQPNAFPSSLGVSATYSTSGAGSIAEIDHVFLVPTFSGPGTLGQMVGFWVDADSTGGTVTETNAIYTRGAYINTAATNHSTLLIDSTFRSGGSLANNYGLKINDQTAATNNWAIKTGLGKVEFGDVVTAPTLNVKVGNAVRYADQFSGADAGEKIAAAIGDLPGTGGIVDARGLAGAQTISANPFAGVTKPFVLVFGQDIVLSVGVQLTLGREGQYVACTPGSGYQPFLGLSGTIFRPTTALGSAALFLIDPGTVGSNTILPGVGISGCVFDMTNVPTNTVLDIRSVSHAVFEKNIFTNHDGTRIKVGKSTNMGASISEHLTFRDNFSFGKTADAANGPSVLVSDTAQIVFDQNSIQVRSAGNPNSASIGIQLQGNVVDFWATHNTFGGFYTHVKMNNAASGTPVQCRFESNKHETYNIGYDVGGVTGARADFHFISNPSFVSPVLSSPVNIKLNDFTEWSNVIANNFTGGAATCVLLTSNSVNNMVWVNAPDACVTDNGSANLVFGRTNGQPSLWTKRARLGGGTDSSSYALVIGGNPAADVPATKYQNSLSPTQEWSTGFVTQASNFELRDTTADTTKLSVAPGATGLLDFTGPVNSSLGFRVAGGATAGRYLRGDGTNFVASAGAASGVGSCPANNWVTGTNEDGAPSCAQPGFSNLSGSATLAQLPAGSANQVLGTNSGAASQEQKTLATGTSGTDFGIAHAAGLITFNLPDAGSSARGAVTTAAQTFAGNKTFQDALGIGSIAAGAKFSAQESGPRTADDYAAYISNAATSSTGSVKKYGLYLTSTGTWNGAGAENYGLYANTAVGGAKNWNIWSGPAYSSLDALSQGFADTASNFLVNLNTAATTEIALLGINQSNTASGRIFGTYGSAEATHTAGTKDFVSGVAGDAYVTGTGGVTTTALGVAGYLEIDAGTVATAIAGGFTAAGAAGTITNLVGVDISSSGGGAITNNYGLRIGDQAGIAANNWAVKTGSGLVEFGDNVKLGGAGKQLQFMGGGNPTCAAGNYFIWANSTDLKLKKCQNGTISDLDTGGGSGSQHQVNGTNVISNDPINFQDTATLAFTNPSAGNIQAAVKADSIGPTQVDETANYTWSGTESFTGTLVLPKKTDPASPAAGEIWVNAGVPKLRDNAATPATRFVAVASSALTSGQLVQGNGNGDVSASGFSVVAAGGGAGISAYNAGTATTLARSDHTHRHFATLTWYFAGTPSTGVQNLTLTLPEGITNPAITDIRVTANTTSASSSTFNIQRCTAGCTGTAPTFSNIYSANLTLSASTRTAAKAAAPDQNVSGLAAGDQLKANLVTIGSGLADVTVTMTIKYETTN